MSPVVLTARLQILELARYPSATVPALALPVISYLIFGVASSGSRSDSTYVLVGFAAFAVLGIVMFQFGVGIASERETPWERYVRTLPISAQSRFAARLLVALVFAIASLVPLALLAAVVAPPDVSAAQAGRLGVALVAGAIPLGLLGIALGYLLTDRGALPITNVLYLPLAYCGGLLSESSRLPGFAATISPWLPTRQWSDLLLDFGLRGHLPLHQCVALSGYGVLFAVLGLWAYRRDESRQFR